MLLLRWGPLRTNGRYWCTKILLPPINNVSLLVIILITITLVVGDDVTKPNDMNENQHDHHPNEPSRPETMSHRYGSDVSWPMQQHVTINDNEDSINDIRLKYPNYVEYMMGCYEQYDVKSCRDQEAVRIQRNHNQPKMVPTNYTTTGYSKVKAPVDVYNILREYWDRHSTTHLQLEPYMETNHVHVETNHWSAPTKVLHMNTLHMNSDVSTMTHAQQSLPYMSLSHHRTMIEQVRTILQQWIGNGISLQFSSMYGIRSYTNHTIIASHVDRYVILNRIYLFSLLLLL
jgi:hypothetical protein